MEWLQFYFWTYPVLVFWNWWAVLAFVWLAFNVYHWHRGKQRPDMSPRLRRLTNLGGVIVLYFAGAYAYRNLSTANAIPSVCLNPVEFTSSIVQRSGRYVSRFVAANERGFPRGTRFQVFYMTGFDGSLEHDVHFESSGGSTGGGGDTSHFVIKDTIQSGTPVTFEVSSERTAPRIACIDTFPPAT